MTTRVDTPKREVEVKVRKGEMITVCGLNLYPIMMTDYEEFLYCKDALSMRQTSFPVKYLSKNYLSAIYGMEMDSIRETKKPTGIFAKIINLLCLSLRIGEDRDKIIRRAIFYRKGTNELDHLAFPSDGEIVTITPRDFSLQVRPILAAQNGIELPKEMQNIDLVRSYEYLKQQKANAAKKMNVNIGDLISSVAFQSKIREREICDWTVLEFEQRRKAIERDKRYTMYGQAELSGMVSFKNGNPAPSWEYDVLDDSLGTMDLSEVGKRLGGGAKEGGKLPA